ncbi:hypothetical protein OFM39_36520, partial [Escherichia coli]|nr:hypothetical protein [Escherichia coli]
VAFYVVISGLLYKSIADFSGIYNGVTRGVPHNVSTSVLTDFLASDDDNSDNKELRKSLSTHT